MKYIVIENNKILQTINNYLQIITFSMTIIINSLFLTFNFKPTFIITVNFKMAIS
jgi:hypothetical protein